MTKSTWFLSAFVLVILSTIVIGRVKRDHVAASEGPRVNAEVFEREVRTTLPPGTSVTAVEEFLSSRKVEFSFNPNSRVLHAIVRNLDGSSILAKQSLAFKFYFDDGLKLKTLDTKVAYTGL
jgi:hypothetical protein